MANGRVPPDLPAYKPKAGEREPGRASGIELAERLRGRAHGAAAWGNAISRSASQRQVR